MSTRSLLLMLLWAGCLAFFAYCLLLAIPLVAPPASADTVKAVVENGRVAVVSFFGFLGAIMGLLKSLGAKLDLKQANVDG